MTLPLEITEIIIDNLHNDVEALGACGAVCSDWLVRSRHHMFATLQLWPWRVAEFFHLANSPLCTFANHTKRLELDDLKHQPRSRSSSKDSTRRSSRSCSVYQRVLNDDTRDAEAPDDFTHVSFRGTLLEHQHPSCFDHVESLLIRNVDWTALCTEDQYSIRGRLGGFSAVNRLEFQNVTFHDLREVVRIVDTMSDVRHLTAKISFMKYIEHTVASAATLRLSTKLQSVELGAGDGLPVVLSCITATSSMEGKGYMRILELKDVKVAHHQYVNKVLKKSGNSLQHLGITFAEETIPWTEPDQFAHTMDLSHLNVLRTLRLEGLRVPNAARSFVLEESLVAILERIESSFLDTIHLGLTLGEGGDLRHINWRGLERVLLALHFFGLRTVRLEVVLPHDIALVDQVKAKFCSAMPELTRRGVLVVSARTESRRADIQTRVGRWDL